MRPDNELVMTAVRDGLIGGAVVVLGMACVGWLVGQALLAADRLRARRLKTLTGRIRRSQ